MDEIHAEEGFFAVEKGAGPVHDEERDGHRVAGDLKQRTLGQGQLGTFSVQLVYNL